MNFLKEVLIPMILAMAVTALSFWMLPIPAQAHDTCDYKMNWSLVHSEYLEGSQEFLYWDFENDGSIDAVWHIEMVKGKCHLIKKLPLNTAETIIENRNKHLIKWGE